MKFSICVPTLARYDLLHKLLLSVMFSTRKPDHILIVDNGKKFEDTFIKTLDIPYVVFVPSFNLGVAASWNVLAQYSRSLDATPIICNDDIMFKENTLEVLTDAYTDRLILGLSGIQIFSCYMMPLNIYNEVGQFDETISPRYAYFEDNDYHWRMRLLGYDIDQVKGAEGIHIGSATVNSMPSNFIQEHHVKFDLARANYIRKWGGQPGEEKYRTPYNA